MTTHAADILAPLQRVLAQLPRQPDSPRCAEGFCDGLLHWTSDPAQRPDPEAYRLRQAQPAAVVCECPAAAQARHQRRHQEERQRLRGLLARCAGGLEAYDPQRQPGAAKALAAVRAWLDGDRPHRHLLLGGPLGVGKTHLLVSAHLVLVLRGVRSFFVSSTDLREMFRDAANYDEDARRPALLRREQLCQAQVLCWDDAGDVEGDQRRRGEFAEGLKFLLDRSTAAWGITTNCTSDEWARHPDLGNKSLSRLLQGAITVRMRGEDQRLVALTERIRANGGQLGPPRPGRPAGGGEED